jgi:hypothetical protein
MFKRQKLKAEYASYLERAALQMQGVQVGQYAKIKGRLIKKFAYEEFVEKWEQYQSVRGVYQESMDRGDTLNDAVVQLLDESTAELLLKP